MSARSPPSSKSQVRHGVQKVAEMREHRCIFAAERLQQEAATLNTLFDPALAMQCVTDVLSLHVLSLHVFAPRQSSRRSNPRLLEPLEVPPGAPALAPAAACLRTHISLLPFSSALTYQSATVFGESICGPPASPYSAASSPAGRPEVPRRHRRWRHLPAVQRHRAVQRQGWLAFLPAMGGD